MNSARASNRHRPAGRTACSLLSVLVCLFVPDLAFPCGMSTHGEVATRAARYFASDLYPEYERVLRDHPEAYQAGSAFPDWGYAFGYPDASEEAHWPPFLEAMALYLREQCPRPWTEEDERRIAFFLGVVSHSIADIDWHGLAGVREGFIDVMSRREFHGDWGAAHDVADTGGEFVLSYEGGMEWLAPGWYFPLRDLAAVYQGLGYEEVTEAVLLPRVFVLFVGAAANRAAGRLLYGQAAGPSPFLAEQFTDYAPGGLDSMALRTADWWAEYIRLMEEGVPAAGGGTAAGAGGAPARERARPPADPAGPEPLLEAASRVARADFTERGVLVRGPDPVRVQGAEAASAEPGAGGPQPNPDVRVFASRPYGYLGASVVAADLCGDGRADLAVGAPGTGDPGSPQRGSVYVFAGRSIAGRAELDAAEADQVLDGPEPMGRFGWALALVDLNADGILDLAVSAPMTGAVDLDLGGKVWVYFGSGGGQPFPSSPDLVIRGAERYTRLGWTLASGDLNGDGFDDLLVGAPFAPGGGEQRGLAAVYLSDPAVGSGTELGLGDAAWLLHGREDYDWFGAHLGVARGASGEGILLAGAPGAAPGGAQAAGRLHAFMAGAGGSPESLFTLDGQGEFDKLGWAFVAGDFSGDGRENLALAAPTRRVEPLRQAGQVFILDLWTLHGELGLGDLDRAVVLAGDREFGRMGWRLAAGHVNRDGVADLVVTQPWQGDPIQPVRGGASLWMGALRSAGATRLPLQADARVRGAVDRARLGDAAVLADLNGDGFDDLVLAASRDSSHAAHGGVLSVYLTPPCVDVDGDGYGAPESLSCRYRGTDCDDDPSDDPASCSACACGTRPCAGCARCVHPGAREFAGDGIDSNCSGHADCFIAQAAFGSDLAGKLSVLRAFRDRVILAAGRPGVTLVDAYYEHGPAAARLVQGSEGLRAVVRVLLLPVVGLASLLV